MPRFFSRCSSAALWRLGALALALQCLTGCGGCDAQSAAQKARAAQKKKVEDAEKKKQEEKEKPKDPFEMAAVTPLLSESLVATNEDEPMRLAKPGHWTATVQPMRANEDNFQGRQVIAAVDSRNRPLALPDTGFAMSASRPALLAKGRTKRVQNELLPPAASTRVTVRSSLGAGGSEVRSREDLWTLMPPYQYFFVVLAKEPARYAFLKVADSVKAPFEDENGVSQPHYRVVLADGTKPAPLPANALAWTSVAYVMWDEVNLARLEPEQQQALVDWIHWGGRLIVNGPDSLATLRGSFLEAYLPVDGGKAIEIGVDDLAAFNAVWTTRQDGKRPADIAVTKAWSGIELEPRKHAKALSGAEGLFYEGAVGAGSIVVSAVQLAERDLVNWPGYDGFLNGGLLRRPARRFRVEDEGTWVGLQTGWDSAAYADRARDAYFTTPLRWLSRDAGTRANTNLITAAVAQDPNSGWMGYGQPLPESQTIVDRPSGLGGWNEFGPVSDAAREALRDAAGVRVPGAGFVVACLAVYLVILVPLNWMMFYALGRIEWAWIAAPLIALAGTIAVVRQAQLDIGFVRSQTEIALLELQGDLPRGHLSRYMALYSSLSTIYNAEFEDPTAVATPFPAEAGGDANEQLLPQRETVEFEKYDKPRLRGVPVTSASTQLLHSEQMLPLTGGLRLSTPSTNPFAKQIENKTGLDLSDAVVMRRKADGSYESFWLGQIRNGTTQLLPKLQAYTVKRSELPYAGDRAKAAETDSHKRLNVDPLLKLAFRFPPASDPLYGKREEWRLVARLDEPLPGAATRPAASQTTGATVVVAHLHYELPPAPQVDANSPSDFAEARRNAFDEETIDGVVPSNDTPF